MSESEVLRVNEHKHTFWQDGALRTVVVEYEYNEATDIYTTSFSGQLLRDSTLKWKQLAAAIAGMAR